MKTKVKLEISKDGSVKVVTVQGAGTKCRAVTDKLGEILGEADESSRADTEDLYVQGDSDLHVQS